jgi:hypothetical protein
MMAIYDGYTLSYMDQNGAELTGIYAEVRFMCPK